VYGIVQQAGGFIRVESVVGAGTQFEIFLRRHDAQPPSFPVDAATQESKVTGTILLVEDELPLLDLASRVLRKAGHQVLAASSPDQALDLLSEHPGPIDLLLTDVVMPGMSGPELHRFVSLKRPAVRVLFMSGYAARELDVEEARKQGHGFLQKPFTVDALRSKVDEQLLAGKH
jgi:DNA-binding NtrC family response regulator